MQETADTLQDLIRDSEHDTGAVEDWGQDLGDSHRPETHYMSARNHCYYSPLTNQSSLQPT